MAEIAKAENEDHKPNENNGILAYLDGILRRREDYFQSIFDNKDVVSQILKLTAITVSLTAFTGLMMGSKSGALQMMASAIKVPVLYSLTLAICFPLLYVVIVIMGSRLAFLQTLALILMALTLNAILLASCAPIVLYFTITGAHYGFLKLMHVAIFGFSGVWGMIALWRGLTAMCETSSLYPKQAVRIMKIWMVIFGFVGTQVVWSLRPFVGRPGLPFEIFRSGQAGNFFEAVWESIVHFGAAID